MTVHGKHVLIKTKFLFYKWWCLGERVWGFCDACKREIELYRLMYLQKPVCISDLLGIRNGSSTIFLLCASSRRLGIMYFARSSIYVCFLDKSWNGCEESLWTMGGCHLSGLDGRGLISRLRCLSIFIALQIVNHWTISICLKVSLLSNIGFVSSSNSGSYRPLAWC